MRPMETHETQRVYWRHMRIRETTGYSLDLERIMETNGNS